MRDKTSKSYQFTFKHDNIFQDVKQEASLYAERKFTPEGVDLFAELVFDEEYMRKYRELFLDAQARIIDKFGPYIAYMDDEEYEFEENNPEIDEDFTFTLRMPHDYNKFYNKYVSIKCREYIVSYIMYRWLETKSERESEQFKTRSFDALKESRSYLEKRISQRRTVSGHMY